MIKNIASFVLLALVSVTTSNNTGGAHLRTFDDPTPRPDSRFGNGRFAHSVAIDGNRVLFGELGNDPNIDNFSWQAHLFDAETGALLSTFTDPSETSNAQFNISVAMDNGLIVIGENRDDTLATDAGQAHVFSATTGNLLHTLNDPTPSEYDLFGSTVAIEGRLVFVGSIGHDVNGVSVGQVNLFDASTGSLLRTFDDPTPTTADGFGTAIAAGGDFVVIGANRHLSSTLYPVGQAHLFRISDGSLIHTFDAPIGTVDGFFGSSVAIKEDDVFIGQPSVLTVEGRFGYVHQFDASTGDLIRTIEEPESSGSTNTHFGSSVAVDQDTLVVGAYTTFVNGTNIGQVHLFDTDTGSFERSLNDPTPTFQDRFGTSVAIEGDRILVGADGDESNGFKDGQAHLFKIPEPATFALGIVLVPLFLSRVRSGINLGRR